MCNTCDSHPEEHYENWLSHHLPETTSNARGITINDMAIDAILSSRLNSFTLEEIQQLFPVDKVKADEILYIINRYLSQIEDALLDSISK
jgi:hypothetical protein